MNKIIISLIAIASFSACKSSESQYENIEKKIYSLTQKKLSDYNIVFIVPSEGCSGCISNAENFLIHDYLPKRKSRIMFIITGHNSKKSALMRLGSAALNSSDVFFDFNHKFDTPNLMKDYPKIFYLQGNVISSDVDVNPDNSEKIYNSLDNLK